MVRSLLSRLFGGSDGANDRGGSAGENAGDDAENDGEGDEEAEETNDVWDLIPSWEYDGKYVQSGGHSRGEQERALADIQRQAEAIERSEQESEPHPDE